MIAPVVVDVLRETAQRAVDAVPLRSMAEQVGMPETRLHAFLAGAKRPKKRSQTP